MKLLFFVSFFLILNIQSQEICNNGIDDDGDGLIDLFDDECECQGFASSQQVPSLIPNFSFEDRSCCPSSYSQLNCADTWLQASQNTSDYFNTCGFNDPFNANPYPLPGGGSGYAGFIDGYTIDTYKEYIGACLSSPMLAGNQYQLSINIAHATGDNNLNFVIYGSNSCNNLPFNGVCPTNGWSVLSSASLTFSGNGQWQVVDFTFTPNQDINAIILGGDCNPHPLVGSGAYNYYYIDQLLLAETSAFSSINITPSGGWCSNDLSLTATTDTTGGAWQWYKDSIALPNETDSVINISTNNYGVGNYTVKLTIGNKCETVTYNISLPDFPTADFSFDSVCLNNNTNFTDVSTIPSGSILSWHWDFGDNSSSNLQNPSHLYSSSGTKSVKLIVTSDIGCMDSINKDVILYPNPEAHFVINDTCLNLPHSIINMSTISNPDIIDNYSWDFGDGNTSTDETPNYTYANSGAYTIKLVVESDKGCKDSTTNQVNVFPKPVAEFSVDDDCQNIDAQFTDLSSVSSSLITTWNWNFGDNNYDSIQNPTHLYSSDGIFSPSLIVTTDNGCKDTISHSTTRYPVPNANFIYNPECLYDSLSFTDASTVNAPATITNWVWNFGDGGALVSEQNPKHKYSLSGTYNVTLIVSTNNGCISDISLPALAYPIPEANFTYTSVCENTPPTFFIDMSVVSNGSIGSWEWDFDDGNTSTSQMPSNAYTSNGTYNVELIATSNHNCKDTTELPVTVLAKPTADFSEDKTEGCSPVCVNFQDNSVANASSIDYWFWGYGNGDAGFTQNPSVCYENTSNTNDATYSVTLIVKNDLGCYDTITKTNLITSYHNPISDFVVTPDEANMYEGEIFTTNNSIGADSYFWDFDNDTTSTLFEPVIHYTDTGVYNVMLVANTIHNCSDTSFQNVKIVPVISIFVPNAFTPDGDGNNDGFIFQGYGIDLETTKFYIFDRWGTLIYYTENNTPWDGTYKGQKAVQDTYVYKLFCKDDFGKPHKFIGHVNLLR